MSIDQGTFVQKGDRDVQIEQLAGWLEVHLEVFRRLVADSSEAQRHFADQTNEKAQAIAREIAPWAGIYEKPPPELFMELVSEFKLAPALRGVFTFRAEDAAAARKELLDQDIEAGFDVAATKERRARILAVGVSLERHMRSVVHYGIPLADLIAIAASGHDGALMQALRIDPSILSLPAFASRISRATIAGDRKFFRAMGNALRLEPLSYKDVEHPDLRFLLGILEPMRAIPHLGVNGTYRLLAEHLRVYPTEGSKAGREGDQARSLWQFIARWRKDVSTKKRRRM